MRTRILWGLVISALACAPASADSCALAWVANSCGGERMVDGNADRVAFVSVGQVTIGESVSGQCMASLGVLSAEQAAPWIAGSPGAAKVKGDGTRLALGGLVVTSDPGVFSGRVYAESPDRSSGIALVGVQGESAIVREGSRVNVVGGVSTVSGERVVLNPMVAVLDQGDPLTPLGTINRSVGGQAFGAPPLGQRGVVYGIGLNNVGLLIRTTGLVIDDSHVDYILINDGSWWPIWESGLRVAKLNLGSLPEIGSYVALSGISGVRVRGSVLDAIVKPRKAGDLQLLAPPPPGALMKMNVRREER